jgi:hypothetical protein
MILSQVRAGVIGCATPVIGGRVGDRLGESGTLGNGQARVAGERGVPLGPRAPEVCGAPPCLVQLRMRAGPAQPGLGGQVRPGGVGRPVRHEAQDKPGTAPGVNNPPEATGFLGSAHLAGAPAGHRSR